jgi:hypothetical protein
MSRYKLWLAVIAGIIGCKVQAQELFVFSEPASNMPAKSVGLRVSNWAMNDAAAGRINYHMIPELMWGVNKQLMVHVEAFLSTLPGYLSAEGAGVYAKYRFYSNDQVYRHFRMAAFVRASTNNGNIHEEEITTNGHNTGYQLGWIGTQLLHKTALSLTTYYEHASNNFEGNEFPARFSGNAVNYRLSVGRLILPKAYTGYNQTNMNFMVELIGQTLWDNGKQFLDIAPSVQLIFNSQTRLDIGYKQELYTNMQRTAPNGLVVRVEHLLFNVL